MCAHDSNMIRNGDPPTERKGKGSDREDDEHVTQRPSICRLQYTNKEWLVSAVPDRPDQEKKPFSSSILYQDVAAENRLVLPQLSHTGWSGQDGRTCGVSASSCGWQNKE